VDKVSTGPADELHIEGTIYFSVNGVTIIDQSMWDDVDQLWTYIWNINNEVRRSSIDGGVLTRSPRKAGLEF